MFHHLGTRQCAILSDMAYQQHRHTGRFGIVLELCGTLAYLAHATRRRVHILGGDGLYRVHYQQLRLHSIYMLKDALRHRFRHHIQFFSFHFPLSTFHQPVRPHLYLLLALFAADIQQTFVLDGQRRLQQQCTLAYAGLTTQQQQAAWHYAATQHTVKLATTRSNTLGLAVSHLINPFRHRLQFLTLRSPLSTLGFHHLLDEGAELAALGAASQPRTALVAAFLTEIICLCFSHNQNSSITLSTRYTLSPRCSVSLALRLKQSP